MKERLSIMRRLRDGTDADRVLACVLDPLFSGAPAREIAMHLRLPPEYVAEQVQQINEERGVLALFARAESTRVELGFEGDAVAFLESLLDRALLADARRVCAVVRRAANARPPLSSPNAKKRPDEAYASGNPKSNGGARPPEQSRGVTPPRNGVSGPSRDDRGSYVEGRRAHR